MATQKFTTFDKYFLIHADKTAVTVQSSKIVSNEVKDKQALLEPSYRKIQMNYLVNPIAPYPHLAERTTCNPEILNISVDAVAT